MVLVIDTGAILKQHGHGLRVPALTGHVQRRLKVKHVKTE